MPNLEVKQGLQKLGIYFILFVHIHIKMFLNPFMMQHPLNASFEGYIIWNETQLQAFLKIIFENYFDLEKGRGL